VTTERSWLTRFFPSDPVEWNSIPTLAVPAGASIDSRRRPSDWRFPAHSRWLCRSANRP